MSPDAYNPLAIENLGKSLTEAFLEQPLQALPTHTFKGAGIYGLYYLPTEDSHQFYQREARGKVPIYVGKALSKSIKNSLFKRLEEHGKSIEAAHTSLRVDNFQCRFLIVDDVWIPLGEQLLINKFKPLWNKRIRGFGNKTLGGKRLDQKPSNWDLLHPGRQRTTNPDNAAALAELEVALAKYLATLPTEDNE